MSAYQRSAIAGTYKDLKFKNNTDVPILIEAYTKGRKITFNIWGHETRDVDNREIKLRPVSYQRHRLQQM